MRHHTDHNTESSVSHTSISQTRLGNALNPQGITTRSLKNQQSWTYEGFHLLTDKFPSQDWGFLSFFTPTPRPQVLCLQTYGGFPLTDRQVCHHETRGLCLFLLRTPSSSASFVTLFLQVLTTHWSSPIARAHTITVTEFFVPRKIGGFCLFFTPTPRRTRLQMLMTYWSSPKARE